MSEYSQVLEISARELRVCNNLDFSIANLRDLDGISEVSDTAINLDLVLKELLEGGDVEDLVASGLRSIDDELRSESAQFYLNFPTSHHLATRKKR
jgi:hypothetical protein